jgi:hypothetical protein
MSDGSRGTPPVRDLALALRGLRPALRPGRYVFTVAEPSDPALQAEALAAIREEEGLTLVLPQETARRAGFRGSPVFRCITLRVFSDLEVVGLVAAVSGRLAELGIPCNVLSAFHHDHLLVPEADAERAMAALREMQTGHGPALQGRAT